MRAAFPPGSVTGAPKIQALKVIADLEGTQREAYTGAIGFASPHAGLQLNVAIRTLEVADGRAWLGCGGGIVADSDPHAELREALGKVGADRGGPRRGRAGRAAARARRGGAAAVAAAARPRRRPARDDRRPRGPPGRARAPPRAAGRLRARRSTGSTRTCSCPPRRPTGGCGSCWRRTAGVSVEPRAEPAAATEVALEPRSLAGGLGAHKWLDRPQDPAWLAVDLDGAVLEAAWANVWIEDADGALLTPPADGRILPGITRARLLGAGGFSSREAALTLADLESAQAILLSSSVRLLTPAGVLGPASARARELAARLREDPAISRKTGSYIR